MTCAKQTVTATLITRDGQRFTGTNHCTTPQSVCPRGDMPHGVGYHLCRDVCGQEAHAEVNAIRAAGMDAAGSVIYVSGHHRACDACRNAAGLIGARIVIGEEGK